MMTPAQHQHHPQPPQQHEPQCPPRGAGDEGADNSPRRRRRIGGGGSRRSSRSTAVASLLYTSSGVSCLLLLAVLGTLASTGTEAAPFGGNRNRFDTEAAMPPPPPLGARYGHGIFDRRASKDGKKGSDSGSSGGGIGGNVFWKQWHFPVKTRGRNLGDDEDDMGGEYFDPLVDGGRGAGGPDSEREFESSDRRPWTDLIPRFRVKVEPMTTLKLRKRFYPFKTVIELGADYNTQIGVWQFKSSWEDRIIGGRLTVKGRELQFSKTWLVTLGDQDDIATRLKFRAGIDTGTWRSYARLGFRTERLQPLNLKDGVTLRRRLPLDGTEGHAKLEVRANLCLPEPEIEYSTDKKRLIMGTGDIQLSIDELNLCLEY